MKKLITVLLLICALTICFSACENESDSAQITLTEQQIRSALSKSEGTLDIVGAPEDVTSFTLVVENINASNLRNKDFTLKAVNVLMNNASQLTYGQLKVCNAFSAVMSVHNLLVPDDGNFDSNDYVEEILSIICDGKSKSYENWTISAAIDTAADSITITAKSK